MPRLARAATALLTTTSVLGLSIAPTFTAIVRAADPPYTGVVIANEGGMASQIPALTDLDPGAITGRWTDEESFDLVRVTAGDFTFEFTSGPEPFHLGAYEDVANARNDWGPGMDVLRKGAGCGASTFQDFHMVELPVADADGNLTQFAVDLRYRCAYQAADPDEPGGWMHASIRVGGASAPALVGVAIGVDIPATEVGQETTVELAIPNPGRGTTEIGDLSLGGPDVDMFSIDGETCSGSTIAGESSCVVDITFAPTTTLARTALLTIGGGPTTYPHIVRINSAGLSPILKLPSKIVMYGEPGTWALNGDTYIATGSDVTGAGSIGDDGWSAGVGAGGAGGASASFWVPAREGPVETGHYVDDLGYDAEDATAIMAHAISHGCSVATGSFDVLELPVFDLDGSLLSVAFDFEQHSCDLQSGLMRGSVRFHSNLPVSDVLAPSGSTAVAGGAAFATATAVSVATAATDVGWGVSQVALSNDGTNWTTRSYGPSQPWTLGAANGTKMVRVKWKDGAGNWSAVKTDTIVLDTLAPTVAFHAGSLIAGTAATSDSKVSLKVTWTGSDATSGIARYELRERRNAGAWAMVSTTLTSPTTTRTVAIGHDYTYQVRGIDKAGNASSWVTGPAIPIRAQQGSTPSITYTGTWASETGAFLGGTTRSSTQTGATASLASSARSIAWVARKGPDRGKAEVYVNGTKVATIDLYAPTPQTRQVVWAGSWTTDANRTVMVKVLGTVGRPKIDVDAFVTAN